ncbi:hypothetical protein FXO21_05140 [Dyadobacter sp. UC 10]|nr:hypothetical protein FXO21_05140 [Dyadobacter sp. UC 10]
MSGKGGKVGREERWEGGKVGRWEGRKGGKGGREEGGKGLLSSFLPFLHPPFPPLIPKISPDLPMRL